MEIKKVLKKASQEDAIVDTKVEVDVVEQKKPELTESKINEGAKEIGKLLAKEDKITIIVPKDPLNPSDDTVSVCINGYKFKIKRGVEVSVPSPVKDVLKNAGYLGL